MGKFLTEIILSDSPTALAKNIDTFLNRKANEYKVVSISHSCVFAGYLRNFSVVIVLEKKEVEEVEEEIIKTL